MTWTHTFTSPDPEPLTRPILGACANLGDVVPVDLIGSKEAAARCGVHRRTLVRWCTSGRLPSYLIAGRWRVSAAELETFVRSTRYNPQFIPPN